MASVTTFEAYVTAAQTAAAASDYATAVLQGELAIAEQAKLMDGSQGTASHSIDRTQLLALVKRWSGKRGSALGIQRTKIKHVVVSD